jgi:hypothetical protein
MQARRRLPPGTRSAMWALTDALEVLSSQENREAVVARHAREAALQTARAAAERAAAERVAEHVLGHDYVAFDRGGRESPSPGKTRCTSKRNARAARREARRNRREGLDARRARGKLDWSAGEAIAQTRAIFTGEIVIEPSDDGARDVCVHCKALRWDGEKTRTSICCLGGKIDLKPHPLGAEGTPERTIHDWASPCEKGKVLRKFSRKISGALALASASFINRALSPGRAVGNRLSSCKERCTIISAR